MVHLFSCRKVYNALTITLFFILLNTARCSPKNPQSNNAAVTSTDSKTVTSSDAAANYKGGKSESSSNATADSSGAESHASAQAYSETETKHNPPPEKYKYDFIIVGAGTAGCVLANRLTENPNWKVLLLEAGVEETDFMDIPMATHYVQLTNKNWKDKSQPSNASCLSMENGRCHIPNGKVLGGSSTTNYMIYSRGSRCDYDNWEEQGNIGWGYDDVLPYFLKSEDAQNIEQDDEYHGHGGPLTISSAPYKTPIAEAFVKGAASLEIPNIDYNGKTQNGVSFVQAIMKNGTLLSANHAFLAPVRDRPNLDVKIKSEVTKVIFDEYKNAIGVEYITDNQKYVEKANLEVILATGTINTPKILLLSGVGEEKELNALGIKCTVKSPGVGKNLQDHFTFPGLIFTVNKPVSIKSEDIFYDQKTLTEYTQYHKGPLSVPAGFEALAFLNDHANSSNECTSYSIVFASITLASDPIYKTKLNLGCDSYNAFYKPLETLYAFTALPMLSLPKSKGYVTLKNNDPNEPPLIQPNYLTEDEDIKTFIKGINKCIEISKTEPMQKFGSELYDRPVLECIDFEYGTDEYWECALRNQALSFYNYAGTCKMGPSSDPDAVVDPELNLHGAKKLRIVNACIIPQITTGHLNAAVYMIAEKAADLIKKQYGYYEKENSE